MTSEYWDVLWWPQPSEGRKSRPIRCGYAKRRQDGGFYVTLEAVPTGRSERGLMELSISQRQERPEAPEGRSRGAEGRSSSAPSSGIGDEIPF